MLTSIEIVALTLVFVEDHARLASRHTEKQKKNASCEINANIFSEMNKVLHLKGMQVASKII